MSTDTAQTNGKRAEQKRTQPGRTRSLSTRRAASLSARQIATLASALIERYQFASQHGLGISHLGARDLYAAGGYPRKLTNAHYLDLYERGDIAERLVEAFPKATWVPGTSIFEDEDPDNITPWEIEVNGLFDRLDVWNVFKRADILSRIGENGYSVILIGDNTKTPLDQEISTSTSFDNLIYLQPLHQKNATILEWDEDVFSERYSYPLYYQLKLGAGKGRKSSTRKVHWSRLIHFTEGGLDNPVYGPPALRSIYNRLHDAEKIFTAGSEAAFKRMDPGAAFSLKEGANLVEGGTDAEEEAEVAKLQERIDEFYHGLRRYLMLDNMDVTSLTAPVHNFGSNIDSLYGSIAGAKGFPQRLLKGSEEAQLASEQDRSNWQDQVDSRRLLVGLPHVRLFVNRVGRDNPEEWDIYWPTRDELNDHEKAELAKTLAEANKAHFEATGEILYTANEIRDKLGDGPLDEINQEGSEAPEDDEGEDQSVSANRDRNPSRVRALRSGKIRTLLSRKRAHIERKNQSRGIVLVAVQRSLSHADDRSEQHAVRRIADSAQSSFASLMRDLWAETFNDDDSEILRLSLDNQSWVESFAMSRIDEMEARMRELVSDRYLSIIERVGKASLRVVEKRKSFSARRPIGRFNRVSDNGNSQSRSLKLMDFSITNPRAIAWAQSRSSALVTEIMPDTRAAVRSIIADGIKEGRAPRVIAKEIRERVGLRSDQLETLAKFKAEGASESQVERRAKQLLKQRAELISRTETMNASNNGLREMWYQAVDNDLLPGDVKREWIATEDDRTRDSHADLDGEQTGLNEAFSLGFEPGSEPACRCSQGIV